MADWYIIYKGQKVGPMTKENIMAYHPTSETKVWTEGMPDWQPIFAIPELMEMINSGRKPAGAPQLQPQPQAEPQPQPQQNTTTSTSYASSPVSPVSSSNSGTSDKDKTVAGILAILLGCLGIQYFYLGKTNAGIICIVIFVVSLLLYVLVIGFISMIVMGILMLIQGIKMLTMSQAEFEDKYVYTEKSFPLF